MRIQLLTITLFCAGNFLAAAQSDSSTGIPRVNRPNDSLNSSSSKSQDQTQSGSSSSSASPALSGGSSTSGSGSQLGATGRMSHQEIRASKLTGSSVKTSGGQDLGKIEDVIINPNSGRIDFAVISYSGSSTSDTSASASTSSTPSPTTSSTSPGSTPGAEKLVAVPWQLIRPSGMLGAGASSTSASTEQVSFMFTGDKSKLDTAPSFTQSNWPDISDQSWRQNIYSAFGVQPGSAFGGSRGIGGSSSGSSSQDNSSSGGSASPGSSPDSSTSPNSGSSTSPNSGSSSSSSSGNP